jgi:hypothetical protein
MFTCDRCHKRIYRDECRMFSRSFGPCESCGKAAHCTDCHCTIPPKKPRKAKEAGIE